jgi:hypothetical protein
MAEGCPERLAFSRADREFLPRVRNFRRDSLPGILDLQGVREDAHLITEREHARPGTCGVS